MLDTILQPETYPDLYGDLDHVVRINYYPPRGDNKEGWDNIDIFGWMGYPMQIKIDFLCRDSILAAPIVLDLALFMDLAQRGGPVRHPGMAELLLQGPAGRRRGCTPSTTSSSSRRSSRTRCAIGWAKSRSLTQRLADVVALRYRGLSVPGPFGPGAGAFRPGERWLALLGWVF